MSVSDKKRLAFIVVAICAFIFVFYYLIFCYPTYIAIADSMPADMQSDGLDAVKLDITDFGAIPNDMSDCAESVSAAINQAKMHAANGRKVILNFPTGRYDIYPDKAEERTLFISNTTGASASYRNKK